MTNVATRPDAPAGETSPPRKATRWHPQTVVVVTLSAAVSAGAVLRHLADKPLWRDEAITVSVASRPVGRILLVLPHHDGNAGVYYLLLHVWFTLGHSPAWARGFSAACFIATAALAAWAGTRGRGWETGLACGLLVALNPFLIYYGQEARPYALAVLLAVAATVALFWQDRPSGPEPTRAAFAVAAVALVYADLFALLYLGALAAAVTVVHWRRHQPLPAGLRRQLGWIALASAPLAGFMMFFERGQISWLARPSAGVLVTTLIAMSSGRLGLALVLILATAALVGTRRSPRDGLIVTALAATFVVPPLALWTVAQVVPTFIDRYVICSAVALVGLAAAGLATVRQNLPRVGRVVALALLVALLVLFGRRTARLEAEPFKVDNAPAVVKFIAGQSRPEDAIAYAGGGLRTLLEATLSSGTVSPTLAAFPRDVALAPGGETFRQHDLYAREVSGPELASRLGPIQRLWLVTDPGDQSYPRGGPFADLRPLVTATFASAGTTSFGAIDVTLLVRRP